MCVCVRLLLLVLNQTKSSINGVNELDRLISIYHSNGHMSSSSDATVEFAFKLITDHSIVVVYFW